MTHETAQEGAVLGTIVVGVDGREGGRDAIALAARLALLARGEVVAVRVVPAGSPPDAAAAEAEAWGELIDELAEARLGADVRVVCAASPARGLHRIAEEERADAIVVGSTRQGRIGRVLAGDDVAATLRGAPCAVAVAPRGFAAADGARIRRIGVGFDGGAEARQAFDLAAALGRECDAPIVLRSVVGTPIAAPDVTAYARLESRQQAEYAALAELHEVFAAVDADATGEVRVGSPVEELVALSTDVEVLVVGSRGWGALRRLLLGSTSTALTRKARCPVLVLPRGAAAERAPA